MNEWFDILMPDMSFSETQPLVDSNREFWLVNDGGSLACSPTIQG